MRPTLRHIVFLLVSVAGVTLPGCGEHDALEATAPSSGVLFLENPDSAVSFGSSSMSTSKAVTKQDGGELTIGKYKVSIPKLGLSTNATVTVTLVDAEFAWIRVTAQTATLVKPMTLKMTNIDETDGQRQGTLSWCRLSNESWLTLAGTRSGSELTAQGASLGDFRIAAVQSDSVIQWIRWLDGPGYETKWIEANKGGDVKYGRYKLDIPQGALAQNTYITVRDPGSGYLECELEPHGLQFLSPVTLETDLNGANSGDYDDWTTYWLNENADSWEDQGGEFSSGKVYSELWHFSVYRPGRAGW